MEQAVQQPMDSNMVALAIAVIAIIISLLYTPYLQLRAARSSFQSEEKSKKILYIRNMVERVLYLLMVVEKEIREGLVAKCSDDNTKLMSSAVKYNDYTAELFAKIQILQLYTCDLNDHTLLECLNNFHESCSKLGNTPKAEISSNEELRRLLRTGPYAESRGQVERLIKERYVQFEKNLLE